MESRTYQFNNSKLTVIFGDLVKSEAEVVVSSDDTVLSMGGGVSRSIRLNAGNSLAEDTAKHVPAKVGDVVVTSAGALTQKYIFHCITVDWNAVDSSEEMSRYIIRHSVEKCFSLMNVMGIRSIAFPIIGTGAAKIPLDLAASNMIDVFAENLRRTSKELSIELYLFDRFGKLSELDYLPVFEYIVAQSIKSAPVKFAETEQTRESHKDMSHDIFISYSRTDEDIAREVSKLLDESGLVYWIDRQGILSGQNFKNLIARAIDTAKVVIFISSESSNNSDYCKKEISYSIWRGKTIIPLVIDDAPYATSIRDDLASIQKSDFRSENDMARFVTSIKYALMQ